MGVPKFFRYMSERYPCLSQLVQEFEIPEIDNLYLDMNGIIHVCSHPNDFDPHFRITEEAIFLAIFHYIEFLFKTIKPQKLFFLAVDGVAPRAKMNQQRGRRFRSAKEAEDLEAEALKKGEALPTEARFDSNCITPGTVFMDRLNQQLQYFISKKISTDPLWQNCAVILSGHETPGEGEHKIMDYIRFIKTQPEYNSNLRHCLYGLDADLIMLGLCTHDPNFCLLREEINYKKSAQKRISTPEQTKFFLLHLSLMREYLDFEFQELKKTLQFPYNLENIIDDWVLMGFLVGNDFIPHLPDLHINKGALEILYKAYKEVLPTLDGYLNENGYLNLKRFQAYLSKVAEFDLDNFEEQYADLAYMEEKTGRKMFKDEFSEAPKSADLQKLINDTADMFDSDDSDKSDDGKNTMMREFCQHKTHYYRSKLDYEQVTDDVLKAQAEGYIRAIQWNLHYYYHGCRSWSWFYPHHYSPFVSDVTNFEDLDFTFDMGKPFLPFHQLLAVLPPASRTLLPEAYQKLMTEENSPIIDFYPSNFETDLNGKQQEWEAIVLIPFIEEERLLGAMERYRNDLTEDENRRNTHGPMQKFIYTKENLGAYKSGMFPDIPNNFPAVQSIWPKEIALNPTDVQFGLRPGYSIDVYVSGFPSLRFVPHKAELKKAAVKVFDYAARGESMVICVIKETPSSAEEVANELLGKVVLVGWPHMVEAKVTSVSDLLTRFTKNKDNSIVKTENNKKKTAQQEWWNEMAHFKDNIKEKRGIELGEVHVMIGAQRIQGQRAVISNKADIVYEKLWATYEEAFPLSIIVSDIKVMPSTKKVPKTLEEAYPPGSKVILLAQPNYGAVGEVQSAPELVQEGLLLVQVSAITDVEVEPDELLSGSGSENYMSAYAASRRMNINQNVFSKITGSCYLQKGGKSSVNVGLNLKFGKKNEEVPGYTKRDHMTWLYTEKTIELVNKYWEAFPEIFDFLNQNNTIDFTADDIFGKGQGQGKDEEIVKWLKAQPHYNVPPITCGAELLSPAVVRKLEAVQSAFNPQTTVTTLKVKPTLTYKSDLVYGNIPPVAANHKLLDRIVCCSSSYTVPLGLRGFIIGIHKGLQASDATYDILFDEPFQGGLSLCESSPQRAYRMSPSAFVNITAEQRTNPVLRLRGLPQATINLRPETKAWGSPQKPSGPSAFASVSNSSSSPYPAKLPVQTPLIATKPAFTQPPTDVDKQKFLNLWRELQNPTQSPPKRPDQSQYQIQRKGPPHPQQPNKIANQFQYPPKIDQSQNNVRLTGGQVQQVDLGFINSNRKGGPDTMQPAASLLKALNINDTREASPAKPGKSLLTTLMTHFQLSSQGLPKYKVFPQGKTHVAQVTLPTGAMFYGVPCDSKESALENAALQALGALGLMSKSNNFTPPHQKQPPTPFLPGQPNLFPHQLRNNLPVGPPPPSYPPKALYNSQKQGNDWRQPRGPPPMTATLTGPPMPPSNWRQNPQANNVHQPANHSSMGGIANVPFVPLQAITGRKATRGARVTDSKPVIEATPVVPLPEPRAEPVPTVLPPPVKVQQNDPSDTRQSRPRKIAANLNWRD